MVSRRRFGHAVPGLGLALLASCTLLACGGTSTNGVGTGSAEAVAVASSDGNPSTAGQAAAATTKTGGTSLGAGQTSAGQPHSGPPPGALDLSQPVVVDDAIEIALDSKRYGFSGSAGQQVSVEVTKLNAGCTDADKWDLLVDVVDAGGEDVPGSTGYVSAYGCSGYGPWTLPADGSYAFVFAGTGSDKSKGSYTARLARLTATETAVDLSAPVKVEGGFDIVFDHDRYTFAGSQGERLSVEVTALNGSCNDKWDVLVSVVDNAGKEVDSTGYVSAYGCHGYGPWTLPANGTYAIVFEGNRSGKGTYAAILARLS
jgi:hypothetical protein